MRRNATLASLRYLASPLTVLLVSYFTLKNVVLLSNVFCSMTRYRFRLFHSSYRRVSLSVDWFLQTLMYLSTHLCSVHISRVSSTSLTIDTSVCTTIRLMRDSTGYR